MASDKEFITQIPESRLSRLLFADTCFAIVWLIVRIYVGWEGLSAGLTKVVNPAWTGDKAGTALKGFVAGALSKTSGAHPDVQGWYATFLKSFVLNHSVAFSYMVSYGELLVGVALILGLLTGIAAFFGAFMNMNYLLAGTVSINPVLFFLELFLILGWRVAGWFGLDRFALPKLGTPWYPGTIFDKKRDEDNKGPG